MTGANLATGKSFHRTRFGEMVLGDSLAVLADRYAPSSINLIMTSPPFGLVRKKDYGNQDAQDYVAWFKPFGALFRKLLQDNGSLVIDIGGSWIPGQPTRSLYHFQLLIMLCEECEFHLAQEFYWWNPSKLPTPAEWVTVRRNRVKDAINCVWWLSPTPWPKSNNRRVLQPYSPSMKSLLKNGYKAMKRPSGHDISEKFRRDNGAAIPPNLIALAHTESNSNYQRYCKEKEIIPHPARYPAELPEYFIRMLTDPGDLVVDPFAGSCVTGLVCERLKRRWLCVDLVEDYLQGALGRFVKPKSGAAASAYGVEDESSYYKIPRPGLLWNGTDREPLPEDGGQRRPVAADKTPVVEKFVLGAEGNPGTRRRKRARSSSSR
jgi:site-specific DNA-methyltransferase (cytosine-N4-specific)